MARAAGHRLDAGAIALIDLYQRLVSPLLPRACRFHPTCSEFCAEAIRRHGLARGLARGALRLLRCQPFSRGGYDPVR
ncbi:MAG TPA: membrane protein insertion efficiency factor YidD [Candidatus Polarisedimenticolia bacterium]|nr:membrane protein insertion efficiency factor YidD [Candidatus Polarisedimenticolia bacterium]